MKRIIFNICSIVVISGLLVSCIDLGLDDVQTSVNDNSELYETEWSTKDHSEGLKFYKDDTVMSFAGGTRSKGKFEYIKYSIISDTGSIGYISFDGLEEYYSSYTVIIPGASMLEDGSMKLYWYKLGEEKGYYEILYRRR